MKYQQVTENEFVLLTSLMHVFADAFEDEESFRAHPPSEEYWKRLLRNKNNIVIVALNNENEVAGGLIAYELQKFEKQTSEIYLYDLAVTESYRRQGIATQLISKLQDIARDRGAKVIFVQADNVDAPAVALYTKLASSIEKDITHFDIPVHSNAQQPK